MPLAEGQFQLRDLVMGEGTPFSVQDATNPFSTTVRADQGGPRAWADGSWSGAEWAAERVVPMRFYLESDGGVAEWLDLHQQLAAAFAPSHEDLALTYMLGGQERVLFGRPRLVEQDVSLIGLGRGFARCAFVALDPLIYSADEHSTVLVLPAVSGGLTVPITAPVTIPATVTAGRATISNSGTAPVGLNLRIDGPVVEPRVSLLVDGVTTTLRLWLTLIAGQWLDIDTAARTVYLNGTASRRGNAGGGWPILPPGSAEIAFDAATYEASAQLTATWRDAWH